MRAVLALLLAPAAAAHQSAWVVPFDSFEPAGWECFDEINPFAMAFDASGRPAVAYQSLLESSAASRPARAKLIPTIVNDVFEDSGARVRELKSAAVLERWLSGDAAIEQHAADLARLAEPYDGIELDYEKVPDGLWANYAKLVETLAARLRPSGKSVVVTVEAGPLWRRGGALAKKHWPALGAAADRIKIMAYYERGDFSDKPGAGVSQAWVEETGRLALAVLPADKTSLAFSLAATDWEVPLPVLRSRRKVARLHYRQALKLLAETGAKPRWDPVDGAPAFRYVKDGRRHEVWFEDERSMAAKVAAAKRLGAGVSLWYLGSERPDLAKAGFCADRGQAEK